MKKLNYLLLIVSIINIIFAFHLFSKEGYVINVNSKNKEIVKGVLNGEIDNVNNITKIVLGQGWHSGELTIYHSFGKTDELRISEGMFKLGDLEQYIRTNGYNLDKIGITLIGISMLILIYLFVYKYVNIKKYIHNFL